MSPAEFASIEVGMTSGGEKLLVWCKRHKIPVGIFTLAEPLGLECHPGTGTLFELGQTVVTSGVNELVKKLPKLEKFINQCIWRHRTGDSGDICQEDKDMNFHAMMLGNRILSSYNTDDVPDGKLWVITEADRSVTTVLLPNEY